jgi:hypothetical protein
LLVTLPPCFIEMDGIGKAMSYPVFQWSLYILAIGYHCSNKAVLWIYLCISTAESHWPTSTILKWFPRILNWHCAKRRMSVGATRRLGKVMKHNSKLNVPCT